MALRQGRGNGLMVDFIRANNVMVHCMAVQQQAKSPPPRGD